MAGKRHEVEQREAEAPFDEIARQAASSPAPRPVSFRQPVGLIAEVKRRSPSQGDLKLDLDPVTQSRAYERGGADAISVLTDSGYFGGSFHDLEAVKSAVALPVLCKDFLVTAYQVYEARAWGADLALLIVAAMDDDTLIDLFRRIIDLGMTPLVEVHDQHELARALALDARLIGINNRDLSDFSVNLLTTEYLAPLIPDDVVAVSESGITTRADVRRVADAGAGVVLVGESLMRSDDPAATIHELVS